MRVLRFDVNDVDILSRNLRVVEITNIINILKSLLLNSSCSSCRRCSYLFVKNSRVNINCEKTNIIILKIELLDNEKFEENSKINFLILVLFFFVSYSLLLKSTKLSIDSKIINFFDRLLILFNFLNIYRDSTSKLISSFEN